MVQHTHVRLAMLGDVLMGMETGPQKVALAWGIGQYSGVLLALEYAKDQDTIDDLLELLDEVDREEVQPALEME